VTAAPDIRLGGPADEPLLIALFDEAVEWMVARGQPDQWGTLPAAQRPDRAERIARLAHDGGVRVAELGGRPVGVLVIADAPDYVSAPDRPERYIMLLITSRRHAGQGLGAAMIRAAAAEARAGGAVQLRVDCWAGAPDLVRWYERQGFTPTETYQAYGKTGQVFAMALA
jgi:GNAT superfamily N-acetyltransferase